MLVRFFQHGYTATNLKPAYTLWQEEEDNAEQAFLFFYLLGFSCAAL